MKTNDLVELAARNIREALLRNSLTTLGIGVGVASLVAMLSLGIGLQQMADRRLARSGLFDTIVVSSRRSLRGFERAPGADAALPAESRPLDEPARLEIARLPDVLEAAPDLRFMAEVRYDGKPHLTMVAGLPPSAPRTGMPLTPCKAASSPLRRLTKPFCKSSLRMNSWGFAPGRENRVRSWTARPRH